MQTINEEEDGEPKDYPNPPTPDEEHQTRIIGNGWQEYATLYGRYFYYNPETGQRSWKPPRRTEISGTTRNRMKSSSLPANATIPWEIPQMMPEKLQSQLSLPNDCVMTTNDDVDEPKNVGKILRVGKLHTALLRVNNRKVKKKWITSITVLTEFYIIFTEQTGTIRRLLKKSRTAKTSRFYLPKADINKETVLTRRDNVYRLSGRDGEILIHSNDVTEAETWYHAVNLVITKLKTQERDKLNLQSTQQPNNRPKSMDVLDEYAVRQNNRNSFTMSNCDSTDTILTTRTTDTTHTVDGHYPSDNPFGEWLKMKFPSPPGWIDKYDPKMGKFYYLNCITGKRWYANRSRDGFLYFYEDGTNRSSWLLPSIYLDANPRSLKRMTKRTSSIETDL